MIVNVWFEPQSTGTLPLGLIEPLGSAEAVMILVSGANTASMVWLAVTLKKM